MATYKFSFSPNSISLWNYLPSESSFGYILFYFDCGLFKQEEEEEEYGELAIPIMNHYRGS